MNEIKYEQLQTAIETFGMALRKAFEAIEQAFKTLYAHYCELLAMKKKKENTRKGWVRLTISKIKQFIIIRKPFKRARANL